MIPHLISRHRSAAFVLASALLAILPGFQRLCAATFYLDVAAAAGGDGSSTKPWNAVSSIGLTKLKTGDVVYIQGGDYSTQELALLFSASQTGITFAIDPSATKQAVFKAIQVYNANSFTLDGLLPGHANRHYSNSSQMIKTVGLNTVGLTGPAHSVLIRQSTNIVIRGVECDQSAMQVGVDDANRQQHGIAVNGTVNHCILEYNYVHDTIGDGINLNYNNGANTGYTNTAFDVITTRYNYVNRVGDDCFQGGSNLDIYGNLFDQGGVQVNYGGHPDVIQINPFCSYVRIHENVLADAGQQPFVEKAEGEIYIYNNLILCLRSATIGTAAPGQSGGPAISLADGSTGQVGYQGTSFGNFIFANNILFNDLSGGAFKGAWTSNGTNNVIFTGNVYINVRLGAPSSAQFMCEKTSLWWDLPGALWYDTNGNATAPFTPRYFGTSLNKNPGLVDPVHLDFHLTSGSSPLVGLSKNLTQYGITTDFDGNNRPATGNWTAGPYQWTGGLVNGALAMIPTALNALPTGTLLPSTPTVSIKVN